MAFGDGVAPEVSEASNARCSSAVRSLSHATSAAFQPQHPRQAVARRLGGVGRSRAGAKRRQGQCRAIGRIHGGPLEAVHESVSSSQHGPRRHKASVARRASAHFFATRHACSPAHRDTCAVGAQSALPRRLRRLGRAEHEDDAFRRATAAKVRACGLRRLEACDRRARCADGDRGERRGRRRPVSRRQSRPRRTAVAPARARGPAGNPRNERSCRRRRCARADPARKTRPARCHAVDGCGDSAAPMGSLSTTNLPVRRERSPSSCTRLTRSQRLPPRATCATTYVPPAMSSDR